MGKVDDLRQVGPLDRGAEFDAARARLLAEENFEEGGLAGAVVAEQGDALAARDLLGQLGFTLERMKGWGINNRTLYRRSMRCWMDMARR